MKKRSPPPTAVRNVQRSIPVSTRKVQQFADAACPLVWKCRRPQSEMASVAEVTVSIVSDRRMAALHKKFCGISGTTDVLTFQHGEIVIGAGMAKRQARIFHSDVMSEIQLYLLHGLLHLAGFDDVTPKQCNEMERVQEQLLASLRRARDF